MTKHAALAAAALLTLLQPVGRAATPPTASPMARGQHPRVLFTGTDLEGIRARVATYYRPEFQSFIDLVTAPVLNTNQQAVEAPWGALNNAFLAVLGPAQMQARGFTYAATRDTSAEFCHVAMNYARQLLPRLATAAQQPNEILQQGFPDPYYFPVLATYDWCFPHLSLADRNAIVDAYVAAYNAKYKGQDPLTMKINSMRMVANNRGANALEDIMGIVAFWGDPYPGPAVQQELYDTFYALWFERQFVELDRYYTPAAGWHEDSGGYFQTSFTSLSLATAFMQSALGESPTTTLPYFTGFAPFVLGNIKPHSLATSGCASGRCPVYLERWGTTSGGIDGFSCKNSIVNTGLLRMGSHPNAGLSRWLTASAATEFDACTTAVTKYGGPWTNAVLFWFVLGDREVAPRSPTAAGISKTLKLGLGEYTMKSGYGPSDSLVTFWGPTYRMYGHSSFEVGHFSIHKFGDLILTAANDKSGDARINYGKDNVFRNTIGIRKGDDPLLAYDGRVADPFFDARGLADVTLAGQVTAEHLANDLVYVAYDGSRVWAPSSASLWQRSFARVFGPPDHEYVVILDRVQTPDPSNTKVWKAWVPVQPSYVDGTVEQPRAGKWSSHDATTVRVTNEQSGVQTPYFDSAPTHGRLFMRMLSPGAFQLNLLGGPGREFQSGNDDGATPWGSPAMTDAMRAYLGWGRIEVIPQTRQPDDVFLSVMQFGDSRSLSAMSGTDRLNAADGKMMGVHLRDPLAQWVFMFARRPDSVGRLQATTYSFTAATALSQHLVADLMPRQTLYIDVRTSGSVTTVTLGPTSTPGAPSMTTTSDGILRFSLDGARVLGPPQPPGNVRIVTTPGDTPRH